MLSRGAQHHGRPDLRDVPLRSGIIDLHLHVLVVRHRHQVEGREKLLLREVLWVGVARLTMHIICRWPFVVYRHWLYDIRTIHLLDAILSRETIRVQIQIREAGLGVCQAHNLPLVLSTARLSHGILLFHYGHLVIALLNMEVHAFVFVISKVLVCLLHLKIS